MLVLFIIQSYSHLTGLICFTIDNVLYSMEILAHPYPKFHLPIAAIQTVTQEFNQLDMEYNTGIGEQNMSVGQYRCVKQYCWSMLDRICISIKQFSTNTYKQFQSVCSMQQIKVAHYCSLGVFLYVSITRYDRGLCEIVSFTNNNYNIRYLLGPLQLQFSKYNSCYFDIGSWRCQMNPLVPAFWQVGFHNLQ